MAEEVKMCEHCQSCRERGPSRPEEPLEMPIQKAAIEPMEMLGRDIGQYAGIKYLTCVDRYSGYPLVGKMGKTSSTKEVIKLLQGWFRTFGLGRDDFNFSSWILLASLHIAPVTERNTFDHMVLVWVWVC